MAMKKIRNMKVYSQSGYNYKATPTIVLKGEWLKEAGFDSGMSVTVHCEEGRLVITPREASNYLDVLEGYDESGNVSIVAEDGRY